MYKIDVVGGGFSGLVQAYYLVEAGLSVRLIEKQERLGGLIQTRETQGFVNESAANAILANREIERIAQVIGVKLYPSKKASAKRFVFRGHRFRRFPLSVGALCRLLFFLLKRTFKGGIPSYLADETLKEWGDRTLGAEASDYLLEPAMQGVFACGIDQLDAQLVLSSLFTKRQRGSLKGSVAPEGGLQDFIDSLRVFLERKGCDFVTNHNWQGEGGSSQQVIAVGLNDLKQLVAQGHLAMPASLESTRTASLTSVKLMFSGKTSMPLGFGGLFPREEKFNCLGVLFNHGIFDNRVPTGGESETWILNDALAPVSSMEHENVLELVYKDRTRSLQQPTPAHKVQVDQWSQKIPIYDIKLRKFISDLQDFETPYLFIGNYLGDLGLGKIIFKAQDNAKHIRRLVNG